MKRPMAGRESGSVLLWVMMAGLFTVGALGIATRLIPSGTQFAARDADTTYAFIAAESGVNYVAYKLATEGPGALADLIAEWVAAGSVGDRGYGEFQVVSDGEYVYVTGKFGDARRTLRAKVLQPREQPQMEIELDAAVFAVAGPGAHDPALELVGGAQVHGAAGTNASSPDSVVLLGGANIHGNVYVAADSQAQAEAAVSVPHWITLGGDIVAIEPREYPLPQFPQPFSGLPARPDVRTSWDRTRIIISEPGQYHSIFVGQGPYTVVFDTRGGDLYVRTTSLQVTGNGTVEVTGGGRLHLYVDQTLELADKNFNVNGDPMKAVIYYAGHKQLTLASGFNFSGVIYVKNADVHVAGSFGPHALIFSGGSKVTVNGGAKLGEDGLVYAPAAHVRIGGAAETGMIIANSVRAEGGARITHRTHNFDALPLKFGQVPGEEAQEDQYDAAETLQWHVCWTDCAPVFED